MGKKEGSKVTFAGFMSFSLESEQTAGLAIAKGNERIYLRP
jgi:hypothetical protein